LRPRIALWGNPQPNLLAPDNFTKHGCPAKNQEARKLIIPLTQTGRATLAQAVALLLANPADARARALFEKLPPADRARLLDADPVDVLITAARAYRLERPSIARNFKAGLLVLQFRKVLPTIAQAQEELRKAQA
jgi:hypothetical protein